MPAGVGDSALMSTLLVLRFPILVSSLTEFLRFPRISVWTFHVLRPRFVGDNCTPVSRKTTLLTPYGKVEVLDIRSKVPR